MKKQLTVMIDREKIRKRLPSAVMRSALYRSGAGVHADQQGRYGKRDRARLRQEERAARLYSE